MSNANAAAKVFGLSLLSLFLSSFHSVNQLLSLPLPDSHTILSTRSSQGTQHSGVTHFHHPSLPFKSTCSTKTVLCDLQ